MGCSPRPSGAGVHPKASQGSPPSLPGRLPPHPNPPPREWFFSLTLSAAAVVAAATREPLMPVEDLASIIECR